MFLCPINLSYLFIYFSDFKGIYVVSHTSIETQMLKQNSHVLCQQGNGYPFLYSRDFHRQRSLAGCSPWGHKESDMTE